MVDDSNPTAAQLEALKVADLKSMCKDAGLKISGRKQELIDRLLESFASDDEDEILLLEEEEISPESTEELAEIEEEVFEAEVYVAELDVESDDDLLIDDEDEVFEAEVFEAELFEEEEYDLPPIPSSRPNRLAGGSLLGTLTSKSTIATLLVILVIAGGGYWWWTNNLDPFVAEPIEYGDQMNFAISSGSFDVEGEEMVRELDNRLNGALSDVCENFKVDFTGTGNIAVAKGGNSELLNPSDSNLVGVVQARDAYGLTFLAVEQELNHQLSATVSSKTWLGDQTDNLCSVPVGPISGYSFAQTSKSWTELTSKALLSTHSSVTLDNQGEQTVVEGLSYGVPDDALSDLMPELLLPLKPVELTPIFGNSLLEEGQTGTSGNWRWAVGSVISVGDEMGLQINMAHTEVEGCVGRANMVLYVVPSSPWAVQQQVDIRLEKSRYDSPECGVLAEYLLDRALPEGSISLQYTLVRTSDSSGEGMIDWQSSYGNRPGDNSGALSGNENWGGSGLHMPDRSDDRSWPLEQAIACIINQTLGAEEASAALATGGYVYRAIDDRSHGLTEWNVSWVDDNDAGWVRVEERTENCSILDKGSIGGEDKPAHRRESIPTTATLQQVEARIIDPNRYPILVTDITESGSLSDDTSIGYLLTVPPEASDLLDLIDGLQEGSVVVFGQREWTESGMDHTLSYVIDGETGRMAGWVKTSTNT
ncbi:SAP domain-containing protein [Euryarchaeota archaeon]|nr:SAP domain-containing protein [Euryarchaeota archaeon]